MSITLLCLVKGNTTANAFSVKISRDEPISELKKVIKAENAQTFANVDTKDIKLWKVDISLEEENENLTSLIQKLTLTSRKSLVVWNCFHFQKLQTLFLPASRRTYTYYCTAPC